MIKKKIKINKQSSCESAFECEYHLMVFILFRRSSYVVNVTENQSPGTPILQIMVSKHRPGAVITYSIVSLQDEFQIDQSTVRLLFLLRYTNEE